MSRSLKLEGLSRAHGAGGALSSAGSPRGAFLGLTTLDVVQVVDAPVGPNVKLQARAAFVNAGGPAANAAVTFSALGGKAQLVSRLGGGPLARAAADELRRYSVEVVDLNEGSVDAEVPLSNVVVRSGTGERCVVSANGAAIAKNHGPIIDVPQVLDVVLVDGHYPEVSIGFIEDLPGTVPVVMDAGSWKEPAKPLLSVATAVICSADFEPPGVGPEDVLRFLMDLGVKFAAVTRGGADVSWRTPNAEGSVVPPACNVVDTLGAGDILHGAFAHFVAGVVAQREAITLEHWLAALETAVAVASLSCQSLGTRAWIAAGGWRRPPS
jgi:sugar/nucleoside kinase (ribokinase family)